MNTFCKNAASDCMRFIRAVKARFLVLTLVFAIGATSLFVSPMAVAEPNSDAVLAPQNETPAPTHSAQMHTVTLLRQNLTALTAATHKTPNTYDGKLAAMRTVTVTADGKTKTLCLENGTTVADALTAAAVTVADADILNVQKEGFIKNGLDIAVKRVAYREYTKDVAISYTTEVKYTSSLRQGASKVSRAGVKGTKKVVYRERLENGKVVSTEKVSETVTKQPVSKIILKGTKVGKIVSEAPFNIPLDDAGQPLNFKQKITGKATAYTSDRGDSGAWTASGRRAAVGIVAVDPRKIPYGTKLWIASPDGKIVYGYAIAGDTGGAVRSGKVVVDLYYDTYGECSAFGRRTMNVYIL